jgi:arginine utilization protein RocB
MPENFLERGITMKNKALIVTAFALAAFAAVSVTGCMTESAASKTSNVQNLGTFGEVVIPVKDFESKGLVFTQVEFQTDGNGGIKGKIFTYYELLKEAQKVGADAIVNVTIDRHIESTSRVDYSQFEARITETKKEAWYGSALAIRYTGALPQPQLSVSNIKERNFYNGVSTSGEQPKQAPAGNAPAQNTPAGKGFYK